ncbi:efflux RND transporter periplasmic adaptor subunit [Marinihelvus fidelis]|nr:efflux RND transporter periplasmic adaptor subunit [Marinihelvus fidelis]
MKTKTILLALTLCVSAPVLAQFGDGPPAVVVSEAAIEPFPLAVEALGNASANEAVSIRPVISAILTGIHFMEGQYVEAGTMLAELENVEPLAEVAGAKAAFVETETQYQRLAELYKTQAVSQSQLQELEAQLEANRASVAAAKARLAHTVVEAPFAGRLGLRRVSVGSLVGPDTVITTLDDTSVIKLDFDVPEVFLARLDPGLEVTARSAAYPDDAFTGVVSSVDSRVDPVSRTVTVRALIDNQDARLRAGMFLTVTLLKQDIQSLVIPEQAIVPDQSKQFVWLVGEGDIAELREVRTGRRRPGQVEILAGLSAGDRVITEGTQKARAGEPVEVLGRAP